MSRSERVKEHGRGFASFAGKGGFAADLGRFGETTLPFFSMGADALPREGADRASPSSLFFSPLWIRVSFRTEAGSGVASLPCDWLKHLQAGGFGQRSLPIIEGDKNIRLELARAGHMHDI